mgnify:CR=1 FL=1
MATPTVDETLRRLETLGHAPTGAARTAIRQDLADIKAAVERA